MARVSMYKKPERNAPALVPRQRQPKPLSPNAVRTLNFITEFEAMHGVFPSRTHIIEYMRWPHHTSYNDVMFTLVAAGKLKIAGREPSGRGFRYFYALAGA